MAVTHRRLIVLVAVFAVTIVIAFVLPAVLLLGAHQGVTSNFVSHSP